MNSEKTLESILGILDEARSEKSYVSYTMEDTENLIHQSLTFSSIMDETEKALVELRLQAAQEDLKDAWKEMVLEFPEDVDEIETEQHRIQLFQWINMDKKISAYLSCIEVTEPALVG